MRVTMGGAAVDLVHGDEVVDRVLCGLTEAGRTPLHVVSANLDHLYHFGLDSGREGSFDAGRGGLEHLVLLDGAPLVWTAKRLTGVTWELLAGSDMLPEMLRTAARARAKVGFLGGTPRQHQALQAALADRFSTVELAGFWAPERETLEDPEASADLAEQIADAGVDLLVVGLGKPRQEEWVLAHGVATGAKVIVGFGAAADFLAGTATRAPERWRGLGLEWLYRLLQEPRRLARRYLVQGPSGVLRLLTQSRTEELAAAGARGAASERRAPVVSTPRMWRRRVGRWLAVADVFLIAISSLLAYFVRDALGQAGVVQGLDNEIPIALAIIPLWLAVFLVAGAYKPEYLNTGGDAFRRFVFGSVGGLVGVGFLSFVLNLELARLYVLLFFGFVFILGGSARVAVRAYLRGRRHTGRFRQNVLMLGADSEAIEIVRSFLDDPVAPYRPIAFLTDELAVGSADPVPGVPVIGRPSDVLDHAYDTRAGLVLVSPTGVNAGTLRDVTIALEGSPVDLAVAPSLFQVMTRRVTIEQASGVPILHVDQVRLGLSRRVVKRTVDVLVAVVLLTLSLPLLLLAVLAVRLDTTGAALFRQTRVGRDGEEFTIYKFRTMVTDAEQQLAEIEHLNEAGHGFFKVREDPRVTRVGRFLRKWSIDEFPQLVNVLRGDMSMVGPRPPIPSEVAAYEAWHRRRLRVRPGVTGIWQTSGRSNVQFDEAVRMDLYYIENWSLGFDLFLLAKTVLAVMGRRGAH